MNNQTKWLKQIAKVHEGKAVECPNCGSSQTKASFFRFKDGVGYGDLKCEKCGDSIHISRMKFPEDTKAKITELN